MQAEELSDETLLRRALEGSEGCFAALYRRHQGRIYRFALAMSGSATVAEEATQEVFLGLLNGECKYDPSRGRPAGFLLGVARNLVLRHLSRSGRYAEMPEDLAGEAGEDISRRETIEAVRQAVLSLPENYREVVVMCDLEEMDYAGAAEVLQCPVGTIRSRLHRARDLLGRKLAPAARSSRA
ncbi:MAG: RNA polymerase sigma factor [Bryobacteraceae bacterium]|nr:RNA polymerase sigma factor [Bryobacteraceae bacterium]